MKVNSKKKRILFLSPLPPPFGGIASLTSVLYESGLPEPYCFSVLDLKIKPPKNKSKLSKLSSEINRNVIIFTKLFIQLIFNRPMIVHVNSSLAPIGVFRDLLCVLIVKMFFIPVVTQYHGNLPDFNQKEKIPFSILALKVLIYLSSYNFFLNNPSLKRAGEMFKNNLSKNYNNTISNYTSEAIWKYECNILEKEKLTCLFVGNILKSKGCDLIFDLARELPQFNFEFIGSIKSDMTSLFENNSLNNIKYVGTLKQSEVYQYLTTVDIFLFPSHSEGFPVAILEAMSVGLPIVATDVGSLPEMIDEGRGGHLLKVGDLEGFKRALLSFNELHVRQEAGRHNRLKAKKEYSFSAVMDRLIDCYKILCKN